MVVRRTFRIQFKKNLLRVSEKLLKCLWRGLDRVFRSLWAGKRYHFTRRQRVLSSGVCCRVKRYLNADKSQPIGDQIKNSLSTNRLRGENWIQNKTKAKRAQSVIEYKKKFLCPLWELFRSIQVVIYLKLCHPTTKRFVVG